MKVCAQKLKITLLPFVFFLIGSSDSAFAGKTKVDDLFPYERKALCPVLLSQQNKYLQQILDLHRNTIETIAGLETVKKRFGEREEQPADCDPGVFGGPIQEINPRDLKIILKNLTRIQNTFEIKSGPTKNEFKSAITLKGTKEIHSYFDRLESTMSSLTQELNPNGAWESQQRKKALIRTIGIASGFISMGLSVYFLFHTHNAVFTLPYSLAVFGTVQGFFNSILGVGIKNNGFLSSFVHKTRAILDQTGNNEPTVLFASDTYQTHPYSIALALEGAQNSNSLQDAIKFNRSPRKSSLAPDADVKVITDEQKYVTMDYVLDAPGNGVEPVLYITAQTSPDVLWDTE